ncbi:hypothetical protein LTR17_015430 [Elasticomyces elasticus]|nr:hypothetical protein LTR17_015430 [Elasticomyces elasticus]
MSTMVTAEEVKIPRCRLLELPEELQLQIYELVVIVKAPIRIVRRFCDDYQGPHKREEEDAWAYLARFISEREQPALSKSCRSIRNIVLPIYYKCNSFRVCCCYDDDYHIEDDARMDNASRKWLLSMGESNRALLRDFEIHQGIDYGGYNVTEPEVVLTKGMQGLKLYACTRESTPSPTVVTSRRQITFVG